MIPTESISDGMMSALLVLSFYAYSGEVLGGTNQADWGAERSSFAGIYAAGGSAPSYIDDSSDHVVTGAVNRAAALQSFDKDQCEADDHDPRIRPTWNIACGTKALRRCTKACITNIPNRTSD